MDSNIYDDLGIDSLSEADIEEDVKEELGLDIHWSIWSRFWHTKPTISELCDFIEREL
jgi:acyl carrier protein